MATFITKVLESETCFIMSYVLSFSCKFGRDNCQTLKHTSLEKFGRSTKVIKVNIQKSGNELGKSEIRKLILKIGNPETKIGILEIQKRIRRIGNLETNSEN